MRTLAERIRALRLALLQRASKINAESSDDDIRRVYAGYYYLKRALVREALEPGEARDLLVNLFQEPEFASFWAIRRERYRRTEGYKERRRAYDKRRYVDRLKERRSTPEARALLAQRRRAQRAAKRGASA
jgi:hypothetical protein